MSETPKSAARRALPERPNLEHLRNEAKQRLKLLQEKSHSAQLADAQLLVAREYGFLSWRALKADVERRLADAGSQPAPHALDRFIGFYRHDPEIISNAVVSITREGGRLATQTTGSPRFELVAEGEGVFAIPGLVARYRFEPERQALVIATGRGEARLTRTEAALAEAAQTAYVAALAEQTRPRVEAPISTDLETFVGFYSSRLGPYIEVRREDQQLFIQVASQQQVAIYPESETKFFARLVPAQMSFTLEGGHAVRMVLHQNGLEQPLPRVSAEEARRTSAPIVEKAVEQIQPRTAIKLSADLLQRYAGQYEFVAGKRLTVEAVGDQLFVQLDGQQRCEVFAQSERQFFWTVVAAQISFIDGADGEIDLAVLHQSGRDLPVARIAGSEATGRAA